MMKAKFRKDNHFLDMVAPEPLPTKYDNYGQPLTNAPYQCIQPEVRYASLMFRLVLILYYLAFLVSFLQGHSVKGVLFVFL